MSDPSEEVKAVKLTKAQQRLLGDIARYASEKRDGWVLRDMRRNPASITLERLGLVERDYPERGPWPGTVRITMRLTDAGRASIKAKGES